MSSVVHRLLDPPRNRRRRFVARERDRPFEALRPGFSTPPRKGSAAMQASYG